MSAQHHGSLFGNGIYFSDSFSKSECYSYGDDSEYLLLCEVALGKMENSLIDTDTKLDPRNFTSDSLRGMGRRGPDLDMSVIKDGVVYPIGDEINYPQPFFAGHHPDDFTSYKSFTDYLTGKSKKKKKKT